MKQWVILSEKGEIIAQVTSPSHPRFHGFDWKAGEMRAVEVDRHGELPLEQLQGKKWVPAPALDELLHARIDAAAEQARRVALGAPTSLEAVYAMKEIEARRVEASGEPGPLLKAEARARGLSVEELTAQILTKADWWRRTSISIELARVEAKQGVSRASTRAAKEKAAAVDWDRAAGD